MPDLFILCHPSLAISQVLGSKVFMTRDRFNTMCCLESDLIRKCITTDQKAARVHVLPMMQLNFKVSSVVHLIFVCFPCGKLCLPDEML